MLATRAALADARRRADDAAAIAGACGSRACGRSSLDPGSETDEFVAELADQRAARCGSDDLSAPFGPDAASSGGYAAVHRAGAGWC